MTSRRMSSVDLAWAGHWSALVATPLDVAPVQDIRAGVEAFLAEHPDHPLACRIDLQRGRWLPVPAAERSAHLDAVVLAVEPLTSEDFAGEIDRHRPPLDTDIPVRIAAGPTHAVVYLMHAVGDAATFTEVALRLIRGRGQELAELDTRITVRQPARAVLAQSRGLYRSWAARALAPFRRSRRSAPLEAAPEPNPAAEAIVVPPGQAAPSGTGTGTGTGTGAGPGAVGVVLDNTQLRTITRWRNEHAAGASITAVLAARTYLAMAAHGIDLRRDGFYSLFDIRSYLEGGTTWWGNLAKSLFLPADLADPHAVDVAMREVQDTRRALPALVAGAVSTAARRRIARALRRPVADRPGHGRPAESTGASGPITMTFNSMPTLPGLAGLPWLPEGRRRYVGVGYPTAPDGLTVFAVRFRDRMEITASFDRSALDPAVVERALAAVAVDEASPAGSAAPSGT